MVSLCRNIGPAARTMYEGGWDRSKFTGHQLHGRTLGVVGFGRIGQTVAHRALAFGMDVVAYDPFINAESMLDGQVKMFHEFTDILPHCDILSFHVPLNDATRGMLGADTFPLCRKGVLVVNASRGGVVDEDALLAALDSEQCGGAALDVYSAEPPAEDAPLRKHPKVLCTPHLGASTKEAQKAVSVVAAEQLLEFLRGQGIRGAVNAGNLRVDLDPQQSAFADLATRMAQIISPMITRGIARIDFDITGSELGKAAETIERYALIGLLRDHLSESVNIINVKQVADARGIAVRTTVSDEKGDGSRLAIEVHGPREKVDPDSHPKDRTRRIVGRVFDDLRPRIVEINGYHMDMIPAGVMVLIQNEDRPGMIGLVGNEFGEANVNIADMAISRRDDTALMLLKVDEQPDEAVVNRLAARPGILKVATVKLPAE